MLVRVKSDDVRSLEYDSGRYERFGDKRRGKKRLETKNKSAPIPPVLTLAIDPDIMSESGHVIQNGGAVTRRFDSKILEFDQKVIASGATYWGLSDCLKILESLNKSVATGLCVICPRYRVSDNNQSMSDTQVCVGGKLTKVWDEEKKEIVNGRFENVCRSVLQKKLRIFNRRKLHCLSHTKTRNTHPVVDSEGKKTLINNPVYGLTKILAVKASHCCSLPDISLFKKEYIYRDPVTYPVREDISVDHISNCRFGCIVWGTLRECIQLIDTIPVESELEKSEIDAIQIISLEKAIEMAEQASKSLEGFPFSQEFF